MKTSPRFGELLRHYRLAQGLTQEELAARARLSPHAISDLERGTRNRPYRETIQLLAVALRLTDDDRQRFEASARPASIADPIAPTPGATGVKVVRARGSLPATLTALIGREHERAAVLDLLRDAQVRLITLSGFGGVGKTRLALAIANQLAANFEHGVVFVALESLDDSTLVGSTIAQAFEIEEEAGRSAWKALAETLRDRRLLLVLDNFEHVLNAVADLEQFLGLCTKLKLLVTSRSPLHITGEHEVLVSPLGVPNRQTGTSVEEVGSAASVQLFVERARAVDNRFRLTSTNASSVAVICERLDGIPLAIELAAAQVNALTVEKIAQRLDDRFHLLIKEGRTTKPRHQTLQATMDWSFDLLTESERILCRRLSVFSGGFVLEAAELVGSGGTLAETDVLGRLVGLIDKSFVTMHERDGEGRYQMLETVRQYASEKLGDAGESDRVHDRHLEWFADLALRAEAELLGPRQTAWLRTLEAETDNLRAALSWGLRNNSPTLFALASRLWLPWYSLGQLAEGARWLDTILGRPIEDRALRGRLVLGLGFLLSVGEWSPDGPGPMAQALTEESLRIFRDLGDKYHSGWALQTLGRQATQQGKLDEARAFLEQSVADFQESKDRAGTGLSLRDLAVVVDRDGDDRHPGDLYERSLALLREQGDHWNLGWTLHHAAQLHEKRGESARVAVLMEEAQAHFRAANFKEGILAAGIDLARFDRHHGNFVGARSRLAEALVLSQNVGLEYQATECLLLLGSIALEQENHETGLRLLGAVAVRRPLSTFFPSEFADLEERLRTVRAALGDDAYERIWATGQAMTIEQASALALEDRAD